MKRPKFTRSARPAMFDPEAPESFVNGNDDRESDFDGICDTFGVNYKDQDTDAVTAWLKGDLVMA